MDQIKERCIYCGSDVYYTGTEVLIKCGMCGHTLVVAKFENELFRLRETEAENKFIKEQLRKAEQEKQAADDRLFAALTDLTEIRDDQDVLGRMICLLAGNQKEAFERLQFLKEISEKLVSSQDDIFARMSAMNEIAISLQKIDMAENERQSLMNDFVQWSQQIHDDDINRLQDISRKADDLYEGQKVIRDKMDDLVKAAHQHQKTLEAFQGQYTKDRLEELQQLYRQAESLQHDRMFDKAEQYYRQVLVKGGDDPEVYWRLLMCHYCLTYQTNDEGELIPIILNPDMTAPEEMSFRKDLSAQMEAVSSGQRKIYETELSKIDRILNKYREVRGTTDYDVFISVKQQRNGNPTKDSLAAVTLYNILTAKGLKVFNSRLTPPPAGQEYEPYIISALMSAKAMIVVGSCRENMESQWIRNEWSRFQWLQYNEKKLTGKTERMLLCYLTDGMKPEAIPRGLNPDRQAIRADITAEKQLDQALAFLFSEKEKYYKNDSSGITRHPSSEEVVAQMTAWLLRKKYENVINRYESLNDSGLYMNVAQVHLCALCAEKEVTSIDELAGSEVDLSKEPLFQMALNVSRGTEEYKRLEGIQNNNTSAHRRSNAISNTEKAESRDVKAQDNEPGENHLLWKHKPLLMIAIISGLCLVIVISGMLRHIQKANSPDVRTEAAVSVTESEKESVIDWEEEYLKTKIGSGTETEVFSGFETGLENEQNGDYVIDWKDENLETIMRKITGITDRKIKYSDIKSITELDLSGSKISDISALENLPKLTSLNLAGIDISDISVLAKLTNLTSLCLIGNQISNINALKNLTNLTELDLRGNQIRDVSALEKLTNLTELYLDNNQISDISMLENLIYLTDLRLRNNSISNISALSNLTNLTNLDLGENRISSISAIEHLTFLKELSLRDNQISDISALKNLIDLETLYLYNNQIEDISALKSLTNLTSLSIHNNQISDIDALENLTNLTFLYIHHNQITDISALGKLTNLKKLELNNNQIRDINALMYLTNLKELVLKNNHISDISALKNLKKLEKLELNGNPITDYSPIEGLNIEDLYK